MGRWLWVLAVTACQRQQWYLTQRISTLISLEALTVSWSPSIIHSDCNMIMLTWLWHLLRHKPYILYVLTFSSPLLDYNRSPRISLQEVSKCSRSRLWSTTISQATVKTTSTESVDPVVSAVRVCLLTSSPQVMCDTFETWRLCTAPESRRCPAMWAII